MAFRVATSAALVGVVAGGACTSDEQAALADPQTVGEKANTCGTSSYNVITGNFNHDKFNDCFTSAMGVSATCSECYAVTGEYGAKNCKADCLLGWCKSGCLSCTAPAQDDLATCTGFTTPTADPCEETVKEEVRGACTSDEQAALADPQTVGEKANTCGTSSYNVITGNFNHDKFNDCFTSAMGVSKTCSECYAVTGEYGAKNCKADCLLGWCKSGCLSCTAPAQDDLATCTGFATPTADPCEETVKEEVRGACTSDEQAALADPQTVGEKANTCGTSSYNVITGNFNHDKFNDCFTSAMGVSKTCSECYAVTGEYGAKNCKADCLLGWCKSGCLSCTAPAQDDLATCTGFATPTADPCEETVKEEVRGACTSDEQAALADPQTVGEQANTCGTSSYNVLTGNFNHDKFNDCFTSAMGVSKTCSECYAVTGEYGAKNCKADCLLGWCKSGCLSCTAPAQDDLATCTGFATPTADPCEEATV